MILALRTDQPQAQLLLIEHDEIAVDYKWEADRRLATTLLGTIDSVLAAHGSDWSAVRGIIVYQGPGSFTGLRIGMAVANTAAYAQELPIVTARGDKWVETGLRYLADGQNDTTTLPYYGAPPRVTKPQK